MKSIYFFLFAIFLIPSLGYSQSNYKAGYVVNLKGDTTTGYINYKEWDNNPRRVAFKKEASQSEPESFSVKDIGAFGVTGQLYYQRYIVSVSQDAIELSALMPTIDTAYKIDTVFLRVLNRGKIATLYSYKDDLKTRFYLLEAGQITPYELTYHAYYNKDESASIQYIRRFRTQMISLAQRSGVDNDRLNTLVAQSSYSESDLTNIVQNINGNTSRQFTSPNLFGIRFFAGIGVSHSQSKFSGNIDFSDAPASKSVSPKIDAGIDFLINKDIQRFYFRAEVSFSINGSYKFTSSNVGAAMGTETLSFSQYNTSLIPQFVYNFYNKDKLKVFIDAGFAINLAMYNDYKTTIVYKSFPTVVQDKSPELVKNYFSFPLKAGVVANKRLEVYVGYIPPAAITDSFPSKNVITSYQAGVNYLFK